jgi:hypothetical protein
MRRFGLLLPLVFAASCVCRASASDACPSLAADPARAVAGLKAERLLDDTLSPSVQGVVDILVATARRWPRGQVNGTYDPRGLNVYIVDAHPAPGACRPRELAGLQGTLQALPAQRIIVVDAAYLAQLKAAADIYFQSVVDRDRSVSSHDVLALVVAEGPDSAIRSRLGGAASWRTGTNETFEGAVAFLIAHEMGHVVNGLATPAPQDRVPGGTGVEADRFWACAGLVGEEVNQMRADEARADEFAAELLGQIPHPRGRRLRFEFGTVFLQNAELGKVLATFAALSPDGERLARVAGVKLNPAVLAAVRMTISRKTGRIEAAFPRSHPAQAERLADVAVRFSRNPRSAFYGDAEPTRMRAAWGLVLRRIEQVCKTLPPPRDEQ